MPDSMQATNVIVNADGTIASVLFPIGTVIPYAAKNAHAGALTGWLLCDGSAVSRADFPDLFFALGITYGAGDGVTTFNVPDLRGRVIVGVGTHVDVKPLGHNDGVALASRRPQHRHTPHVHAETGIFNNAGNNYQDTAGVRAWGSNVAQPNTGAADGGSGVGTDPLDAPAYIALNFLIRALNP